jgi:hypothetical protein
MGSHDANEFRKRSGIASVFSDAEIHVGFAKATGSLLTGKSAGPGVMPRVLHVDSLREGDLLDEHFCGPWATWRVRFDDGSVETRAAAEFAGSDGSIEPTFPKASRGNLNKSATTRYRKGQKVRCSDGRTGSVRADTSPGGTTVVDFTFPGGSGFAVLRNHEILSLA